VRFAQLSGENQDTPNNSMDVRAKQRLCYERRPLDFSLRVFGFAPRQLRRSVASPAIGRKLFFNRLAVLFSIKSSLLKYL